MQARMKELIAKINEADTAYYKYDTPILSDRDYDQLYDELVRLEKESGITLSGSPTQRVPGALLEGLVPVPHTRPMLSAAKTKSVAEVLRFIAGRAAILSWKLDGLTLVLRYENRELKQAITRGVDGLVGEDVTHTVRMMLNVPLTIPYTGPLEVRGEGVVSWANFKALNETLEDPYADPRGLAAGSIRKLNAEAVRARRLEFFAFDLISDDIGWLRKKEQLDFMAGQGFDVVPHILMEESTSADELEAHIKSMDPGKFGYPVDGLIFEYDDIAYGQSRGATGHHEKRMMALKWQDEVYETTYRGLELAVTRSGMGSLTGVFDDVEINGTTVNHAYLHNVDIYEALALGTGDKIMVYKANMIIPQIAENHTRSGPEALPATCPCCGGPAERARAAPGSSTVRTTTARPSWCASSSTFAAGRAWRSWGCRIRPWRSSSRGAGSKTSATSTSWSATTLRSSRSPGLGRSPSPGSRRRWISGAPAPSTGSSPAWAFRAVSWPGISMGPGRPLSRPSRSTSTSPS